METKSIGVRLPVAVWETIDDEAAALGMKRQEMLYRLLVLRYTPGTRKPANGGTMNRDEIELEVD